MTWQRDRRFRVLFAGVGKNFASSIPLLSAALNKAGTIFEKHGLLVYENNSVDGTQSLLQQLARDHPEVTCYSENLNEAETRRISTARTWDDRPCRMELIAHARNKLLNFLREERYNHYDYIALCDLDHTSPLPIGTIRRVLDFYHGQFDALIANGVDEFGRMYDAYAYRDMNHPFGPEILGEDFYSRSHQRKIMKHYWTFQSLKPVISAYNGLCLLTLPAARAGHYSALPSNDLDKFYNSLSHEVRSGPPLTYQNNSGYDKPIVCEHVTFFLRLRAHGFHRIFVSPKLIWRWQRSGGIIKRAARALSKQLTRKTSA